MTDRINSINSRMNEIRSMGKNLKANIKPNFVSEFENRLNSSMQEKTERTAIKSSSYHPFITVSEPVTPKEAEVEKTDVKELTEADKKKLIDKTIKDAAEKYNIDEKIIRSVIRQESAFDQFAVSRAGAMGLMQLMPRTALELGVTKPFDIEQNINGGVKYLRQMLDRYDGDLTLSLAAYNAGPHRVDSAGGIPDIKETQNYVKRINAMLNRDKLNIQE